MLPKGEPTVTVEAVLLLPTASGGSETAWLPIGQGWRTPRGDYLVELVREPVEWALGGAERRLFLRQRKDRFR
jgi:hypothetical protein